MLILAPQMRLSLERISRTYTEAELFDFWYAYLETKGKKVKSTEQDAIEEGFTEEDLDTVSDGMYEIYADRKNRNRQKL